MLAIVIQVCCSFFDINPILVFNNSKLLLDKAISLNSLLDFQWHLLGIIALLPACIVLLIDKHVRVDFFYIKCGKKYKAIINLTGHLILTTPFLLFSISASSKFMLRAWRSDQGSNNDGLSDLWLIKSILPMGLTLLLVVIVIDSFRCIGELRGR